MHARNLSLLALAALLLSGCSALFPKERQPYQVCGPVTPIYDDADSTHVLAYAQMCYTAWRTPGIDTTSAEGDADLEVTDSVTVVR